MGNLSVPGLLHHSVTFPPYIGSLKRRRRALLVNALMLLPVSVPGRLTKPRYLFAWISEQENAASLSSDQVRAARRDFGDVPLLVLARQDGQNKLETELNTDTAQMSRRGTVRIVQNSGHYIQLDQPQDVIDGILEVVQTARATPPSRR